MDRLEKKVAIVTGGGQGLGEQTCLTLAQAGVTVIPLDVKEEQVKKVTKKIEQNGGRAKSFVIDITNKDKVQKVLSLVEKEFRHIDILINNAGIDVTKPIGEVTYAEWERVIRVNLLGPFIMSKSVWEYMIKVGKGHIINICSTAAKRAWPNASAYHASKWGLLGFSHALHTEGRKEHIKVTAIIVGGMRTPFILERFPSTPLDVLQDPKNVAETIKFVLQQPAETVIPEVMVIPAKETSWP